MDVSGWVNEWEASPDKVAWAMKGVNPYLEKYLADITMGKDCAKVFFPMCGDVPDMFWLAEKGHEVIGLEISNVAIEKFFKDQGLEYDIIQCKDINGTLYTSKTKNIKIYCGDMFLFGPVVEKDFDGVWDRGSFQTLDSCGTDPAAISKIKKDYVKILRSVIKPQSCILLELVIPETVVDVSAMKAYFDEGFDVTDLGLVDCYAPEYEKMGIKGFQFFKIIMN